MKNKLTDLNNYLFEQLERINDDTLKPEELETAIKKAETVTNIAETIIKNGALQLRQVDLMVQNGLVPTKTIPLLLGTNDAPKENKID